MGVVNGWVVLLGDLPGHDLPFVRSPSSPQRLWPRVRWGARLSDIAPGADDQSASVPSVRSAEACRIENTGPLAVGLGRTRAIATGDRVSYHPSAGRGDRIGSAARPRPRGAPARRGSRDRFCRWAPTCHARTVARRRGRRAGDRASAGHGAIPRSAARPAAPTARGSRRPRQQLPGPWTSSRSSASRRSSAAACPRQT